MAGLIDYGITKPELTNAFAAGYSGAEKNRNALLEQQQQRQLSQLQYQNALREQQGAVAEQEAWQTAGGDLAKARELLMQRGLGKQAMAVGTQMEAQQKAKLDRLKTSADLMKTVTTRIMANPDPAAARNALMQFGQQTGTDVTNDLAELDSFGGNPAAIKKWAEGHSLNADQMLSKFQSITIPGVGVQTGTTDYTGKFQPGPAFAEQLSPYQQKQLEISRGQLGVSQGQLKVAQDRAAREGAALNPAENAVLSQAIVEGRLDPNRINSRNAKILATTLMANPNANLLELGVSAAGATASERSLATQTAKMSTAANEANKMVDVVRETSSRVSRTEFPTINAVANAVAKGTGNKDIVQLNTSINALVNSYARAISPTGQPTVSDKNHARDIINSAYSEGQLGAILDVMQQEMSIAREAAGTASTELKAARETARGRPPKAPAKAAGGWGTAVAE